MAVVKAWEQLLVLQLDLSLAVSGRAPQPLNPLSKAQPVQGTEQEESLSWKSSFLSLGATSPTALGVGHRAGGCWWGRRLCGDMGDFVQEGMNEAGGILIQVNSSRMWASHCGKHASHSEAEDDRGFCGLKERLWGKRAGSDALLTCKGSLTPPLCLCW